jgi:hypothetical protein
MALTQLAPPYPVFTDKNGDPLDNGYLYFGVVELNPETNPIQVFYNSQLTQPVAQPIRTSNGYPMRNGAPALIFAGSQFSVTVRDKNSDLVIYSPVGYGVDPAAIASVVVSDHTGDGVETEFTIGAAPATKNATNVYIDGVYQNKSTYSVSGASGRLTFSVAPALSSAIEILSTQTSKIGGTDAGLVTYNQSGTGAVSRTVKAKLQETLSVKDFGAVGDGVTNDANAFNAANTASGVAAVYVPAGTYLITGTVTGNFFTFGVVTISSGSVNSIIQYNDLSNPPFASIAQGALADTAIQPADTQVSAQGTAVWQLGTGAVESIVSPAKVKAAIDAHALPGILANGLITPGGLITANTWKTVPIDALQIDNIAGASLAANVITLPAGTYYVKWVHPISYSGSGAAACGTRIYNVTDAGVTLNGQLAVPIGENYSGNQMHGMGEFTLAGAKDIKVEGVANNGFVSLSEGLYLEIYKTA